jgi:hypothetical protein
VATNVHESGCRRGTLTLRLTGAVALNLPSLDPSSVPLTAQSSWTPRFRWAFSRRGWDGG